MAGQDPCHTQPVASAGLCGVPAARAHQPHRTYASLSTNHPPWPSWLHSRELRGPGFQCFPDLMFSESQSSLWRLCGKESQHACVPVHRTHGSGHPHTLLNFPIVTLNTLGQQRTEKRSPSLLDSLSLPQIHTHTPEHSSHKFRFII